MMIPQAPLLTDFMPRAETGWQLDWLAIDATYDWVRNLRGAPHDPVHHQEGDVWIHTRMVVEALIGLPAWQALPAREQRITFAAAVLHDVEKPATADIQPDGRVKNPGHSRRGAIRARQILWWMGVAPDEREAVSAIIDQHQVPFWLIEKDALAARLFVARQSLTSGNKLLALVAEADARGRICADRQKIIDNVDYFREIAVEHDCLDHPFPFTDAATRFAYFNRENAQIDPRWSINAPVDQPEMIVMSGLPASGKSTWLQRHAADLPVVSLDQMRLEIGVEADENQGQVVQATRELARTHLRRKVPFAWDGTNISRLNRGAVLRLAVDYGYRIRIVALEAQPRELFKRNADRADTVPERAILSMLRRWEYPLPSDAHVLTGAWPEPADG